MLIKKPHHKLEKYPKNFKKDVKPDSHISLFTISLLICYKTSSDKTCCSEAFLKQPQAFTTNGSATE